MVFATASCLIGNVMGESAAEPVLAVRNLSVDFHVGDRGSPTLRDVSFALEPGEVLAIVGESGSGKTTLLNAIMRGLPENAEVIEGSVHYRSIDLLAADREALDRVRGRRIAMVHQDATVALTPTMRIGQLIEETLTHHLGCTAPAARQRAVELLARVALDAPERVAQQWPHQLSGGMRQRAMIALALSCDPEILFMDEPTTGLDVLVQSQILTLFRDLCRTSGVSALFVSHDIGAVSKVSDRIGILYAGELVEIGHTAKVLSRPAHPYTSGLLSSLPRLDRDDLPIGIPGSVSRQSDRFSACVFRSRCAHVIDACRDRPAPSLVEAGHFSRCHRLGEFAVDIAQHPHLRIAREPMETPLIEVSGLAIEYVSQAGLFAASQVRRVVDDVSFVIAQGRSMALVGESGSGKTSIGKAVMRLLRPAAGVIRWQGTDVGGLSGQELRSYRQAVRVVFQNPATSLNPSHDVESLVGRSLSLAGVNRRSVREQVVAALAAVGLDEGYRGRRIHDLSGGEQQRVALARAFLGEPSLVILDEPTSSLDVSVQAQILRLLVELQRKTGCAFLLISHDLAVVRLLADDVVVLRQGRIVEQGSVGDVIDTPQGSYTKALLDAAA